MPNLLWTDWLAIGATLTLGVMATYWLLCGEGRAKPDDWEDES